MDLLVNYGIKAAQKKPNPYIEATGGTVLEYDLDGKRYRSHTFTTVGTSTFTIEKLGATSELNVLDYLVIAGGGGGASAYGGAGAGGYRTTLGTSGANSSPEAKITPSLTSYSIVVGDGGSPGTYQVAAGTQGQNSSAFGITSIGGGFGNGSNSGGGGSGGSGGSGGWSTGSGGAGTAGQGFAGNRGLGSHPYYAGSGGGGAAQQGQQPIVSSGSRRGGFGGAGLGNILRIGYPEFRAGGGGGQVYTTATSSFTNSFGGIGGGGRGGWFAPGAPNAADRTKAGLAGVPNSGAGGGAAAVSPDWGTEAPAGKGGSGIVVVRYEIEKTNQDPVDNVRTFLYNEGVEALGGVTIQNPYPVMPTILDTTKGATSINTVYNNFDRGVLIRSTNTIDLTNYTKLKVRYSITGGHPSARSITIEYRNVLTGQPETRIHAIEGGTNRTNAVIEVDISSVTGSYYIGTGVFYITGNIHQIWVE